MVDLNIWVPYRLSDRASATPAAKMTTARLLTKPPCRLAKCRTIRASRRASD